MVFLNIFNKHNECLLLQKLPKINFLRSCGKYVATMFEKFKKYGCKLVIQAKFHKAPWAGYRSLSGHIRHAGYSFLTPGLVSVKVKLLFLIVNCPCFLFTCNLCFLLSKATDKIMFKLHYF
jgi:hypothetical protein